MQPKSERIDRAWHEAREWFEAGGSSTTVHIAWQNIDGGQLQGVCEWLESQATFWFTSSVWRRPEDLDRSVVGVRAFLEAVETGRIAAFSLNYELPLERQILPFLLTVVYQDDNLALRGFTRKDLPHPVLGNRATFETIAGHAFDLEERLGAAVVWIGPVGQPPRWDA